jgi:hypothetical protein
LSIIAVLAVLGGCSVQVRVSGQAESVSTTAVRPHRETPTPYPGTPRHKVQVRLFVADKYH